MFVGTELGSAEEEGTLDSVTDGRADGNKEGTIDFSDVGIEEGSDDIRELGPLEGFAENSKEGMEEGEMLGVIVVPTLEGKPDGESEGS